jgi:membrane fusion protein (multidrug efflux system)
MAHGAGETWPERVRGAVAARLPRRAAQYLTPRMFLMLLIVGGVLAVVFSVVALRSATTGGPGGQMPVQTVSAVQAQTTSWQPQIHAVGSLHAVRGADLASEIAGLVTATPFEPGDDVKPGALLIQLRDDSDRAQLAALKATAALDARTYQRDAGLLKANAISKLDYDTALATMQSANAQVDEQRALVEKKAIRAPYDGRVGIRQVDVGQYVNAGTTLVTLQQLDPIFVDFDVPQQQLSALRVGSPISLSTDAVLGQSFKGTVTAFDPMVDPQTRNIHVRATIRNPQKILLPGMFANVTVSAGAAARLITLPQTAIVYSPYGDSVFAIEDRGKDETGREKLVASQRFVTVGETRGDQVSILSGLKPKDKVVSAGQLKLKNGAAVKINNAVPLPNNPAPAPRDE